MTHHDMESNMRTHIHNPTKKDEIPPECDDSCAPMEPNCVAEFDKLNYSHMSWNTLGFNAFSALSLGTCAFTVLTLNGIVSLLSCNSVFSILSINSAFSILSTNSAFAVGCVDKRFAVCF